MPRFCGIYSTCHAVNEHLACIIRRVRPIAAQGHGEFYAADQQTALQADQRALGLQCGVLRADYVQVVDGTGAVLVFCQAQDIAGGVQGLLT